MDAFWTGVVIAALVPLAVGAVAEARAIGRQAWPNTFSAYLRRVFDVSTSDGKRLWYGAIGSVIAVLVWLAGHVTNVWP